jgi:hypothetical protein
LTQPDIAITAKNGSILKQYQGKEIKIQNGSALFAYNQLNLVKIKTSKIYSVDSG